MQPYFSFPSPAPDFISHLLQFRLALVVGMDDMQRKEVVYRNLPWPYEHQEEVYAEEHHGQITLLLPLKRVGRLGHIVMGA